MMRAVRFPFVASQTRDCGPGDENFIFFSHALTRAQRSLLLAPARGWSLTRRDKPTTDKPCLRTTSHLDSPAVARPGRREGPPSHRGPPPPHRAAPPLRLQLAGTQPRLESDRRRSERGRLASHTASEEDERRWVRGLRAECASSAGSDGDGIFASAWPDATPAAPGPPTQDPVPGTRARASDPRPSDHVTPDPKHSQWTLHLHERGTPELVPV